MKPGFGNIETTFIGGILPITDLSVGVIAGGYRLTWTPVDGCETEVYFTSDGISYVLLATTGLNIGTYDHTITGIYIGYRIRAKYNNTILNAPINLVTELITGGVRLTWDDNNTLAEHIEIYVDINSAGYSLLATVDPSTETIDHTPLNGETVSYKIRAREGTLPVYSEYSTPITQIVPLVYQDETNTLIAVGRYDSEPSLALKNLINTTIKGLKDDGVWVNGDALYIRGVHESKFACQNWIKNEFNSTLVAGVTFTPKIGLTGNGTTRYINNNFVPSSDAVHLSNTGYSIFFMFPTLTSTYKHCFGTNNGTKGYELYYFDPATASRFTMSPSAAKYNNAIIMAEGDYVGYTGDAANLSRSFKNGIEAASQADKPANMLSDYNEYELAYNNADTPTSYTNGTIAVSWRGGLLTPTEMLALYTRIKYFNDNVGGTF